MFSPPQRIHSFTAIETDCKRIERSIKIESADQAIWNQFCEVCLEIFVSSRLSPRFYTNVSSDVGKRVYGLDSKYPGSTSTQRLKSYGKNGRYLVLVVGPFANLVSHNLMVFF